jgi:hypothetical protein
MTNEIGVLIMEEADGRFGVQLFADPEKAKEVFEQLHGKPGQPPARATFVSLDWVNRKVEASAHDLPLPVEDPAQRPDAWRLGEGPINFPKPLDSKGDADNTGTKST